MEDAAGIGLHLRCNHGFCKGKINNAVIVVVNDAIQNNLFKLFQGQTGIFAVVMCATLLEIRLNNAFTF